jgi:Family of unknown function (DUF6263)
MKKNFILSVLILSLFSCKIQPGSNRHYDDNNPKKVYHLQLNPTDGSQYVYSVIRSTEFEMEVDGKKVDNKNRSQMEVTYTIGRDSMGDIVLNTVYNKIHLYTKNGDTEQEEDADKGDESTDPAEKMLGILKDAKLRVVVSAAGVVKSMQGDEEIKSKLMAAFSPGDTYAKTIAAQQWDQRIKAGLIKDNMQELFRLFPDSAVHVGDRWKLSSIQHVDIDLTNNSSFQLKEIVDGTAVIRSDGDITSGQSAGSMNGTPYSSDLKGKQQGELEMEVATGMLLSSSSEAQITGTISSMGREIPVTISISMKVEGRKLK